MVRGAQVPVFVTGPSRGRAVLNGRELWERREPVWGGDR